MLGDTKKFMSQITPTILDKTSYHKPTFSAFLDINHSVLFQLKYLINPPYTPPQFNVLCLDKGQLLHVFSKLEKSTTLTGGWGNN